MNVQHRRILRFVVGPPSGVAQRPGRQHDTWESRFHACTSNGPPRGFRQTCFDSSSFPRERPMRPCNTEVGGMHMTSSATSCTCFLFTCPPALHACVETAWWFAFAKGAELPAHRRENGVEKCKGVLRPRRTGQNGFVKSMLSSTLLLSVSHGFGCGRYPSRFCA